MRRLVRIFSTVVLGTVLLAACGESEPVEVSRSKEQPRHTRPAPRGRAGPETLEARPGGLPGTARQESPSRGQAMGWIPRDAIAVFRLPGIRNFSALKQTAFYAALQHESLAGLFGAAGARLDLMRKSLFARSPMAARVWNVLQRLEGEAVLGISGLSPRAFLGSGDVLPITIAIHVEVGMQQQEIEVLLTKAASGAGRSGGLSRAAPGRFVLTDKRFRLDILLGDGWLTAVMGPPTDAPVGPEQWRALKPEQSFLAADVVRQAPAPGSSETLYMEGYLNLAPVWPVVNMLAPPQAREVLRTLRVEGIRGASYVAGIEGGRFHDRFTLHAPDHDDVLSSLLCQPALDANWANFTFAGADSASVTSFDLAATWNAIRERLPAEVRTELDAAVKGLRKEAGIDLKRDVLDAFGPHVVVAMKGDAVSAILANQPFEAVLAIQVSDPAAVGRQLNAILEGMGLAAGCKAFESGGITCRSLAVPMPDMPEWLVPSFAIVEKALVLATSPDVLEKSIAAWAAGGQLTPKGMKQAFASLPKGTWAFARQSTVAQIHGLHSMLETALEEFASDLPVTAMELSGLTELQLPGWAATHEVVRDLPPGEMLLRVVPEGVVLDSRTGIPNLMLGVVPAAVVAAIAIPNLLESRRAANESAAIATLRNLSAAQARFQAIRAADRDRDGVGEFAYFGELSGVAPLPTGEFLNPPVMSVAFQDVERGTVTRSGYMFRIFLRGAGGRPAGEQPGGGAPEDMEADAAEQGFIAYAWPVKHGDTGTRSFIIDNRGELYTASGTDPSSIFSGHERPPRPDATFFNIPLQTASSARKDGGGTTWTHAE